MRVAVLEEDRLSDLLPVDERSARAAQVLELVARKLAARSLACLRETDFGHKTMSQSGLRPTIVISRSSW